MIIDGLCYNAQGLFYVENDCKKWFSVHLYKINIVIFKLLIVCDCHDKLLRFLPTGQMHTFVQVKRGSCP